MTTPLQEAIEREIAYWESAGYSEGWANHARNTSVPLLRTILAALEPSETLQAQRDELRQFAETVPPHSMGCPWCYSKDHWAGRVELCCAPSSRAITKALAAPQGGVPRKSATSDE